MRQEERRLIKGTLGEKIRSIISNDLHQRRRATIVTSTVPLLPPAGLLGGDRGEDALDLGLEGVLGHDGAGGVHLGVGGGAQGVDGLAVVDHVVPLPEILEPLLEGVDDLVLGLVVVLEEADGLGVEGLVDGVTPPGRRRAEGEEDGRELGLLVDHVPLELGEGDRGGHAHGEGVPLREAGAEEAPLALYGDDDDDGLLPPGGGVEVGASGDGTAGGCPAPCGRRGRGGRRTASLEYWHRSVR